MISTKQNRHELKYGLHTFEATTLENKIQKIFALDQHCASGSYLITSLYFDTPYDTAYYEKIDGVRHRHKYRIRFYNNHHQRIQLERKSKNEGITRKEACPLTYEEVTCLLGGDYAWLQTKEQALLTDFYQMLRHQGLLPKVIIRYERAAYLHQVGQCRITFDRNIQFSNQCQKLFDPDASFFSSDPNNPVILEVKFNHYYPSILRSLLQSGHTMASANSKYTVGRSISIY